VTSPHIARRRPALAVFSLTALGVIAAIAGASCNKDGPYGCPDDHVAGAHCTNEGEKCTDQSSACGQVYICENGIFTATAESKSPCSDGGGGGG